MAAAAANQIQINNRTRLARFIDDLRTNYAHNRVDPAYVLRKDRIIDILHENLHRDPRDFGRLIQYAYRSIWGLDATYHPIQGRIQYNSINNIPDYVLETLPIKKGGIKIRLNTNHNRFIQVSSYGNDARKIPKGDREYIEGTDEIEGIFDAAKRELYEETGIDNIIFPILNEVPTRAPVPDAIDARLNVFIYDVDEAEYAVLVEHMRNHANRIVNDHHVVENIAGRSADVTSIHYKKYMKYKAKYLALVKSMGK